MELSTVVKREGRSVTYMRCRLQNAGEQYFSLQLPDDALLWGTYVGAEPVRPIRGAGNGIAVPLLDAPRDEPFDLGVIWAQPSRRLGIGASVRLLAPDLDLPAQEVRWNLHVPRDYQVVSSGGNMELTRRTSWYEQGLPGTARRWAGAAWPLIRFVLLNGGLVILGIGGTGLLAYVALRLIRWYRGRKAEGAMQLSPARVGRWVVAGLLICMIVVLLAATLMPALSRARSGARSASTTSNLKNIGLAVEMYQKDHGGWTPPNLQILVDEEYLDDEDVLRSPVSGRTYGYAGSIDPDLAEPRTPVAWDPMKGREGAVVLFMDKHAEYVEAGDQTDKKLMVARRMRPEDFEGPREAGARAFSREVGLSESVATGQGPAQTRTPSAGDEMRDKQLDIMGVQSAVEEPAEEEEAPPVEYQGLDSAAGEEMARQRAGEKKRARQDRYSRAMQMAESYRKHGDLKKAEAQYEQALEDAPESAEARKGLQRVQALQEDVKESDEGEGFGQPAGESQPAAKPRTVRHTYSLGSMLTYQEQLQRELGSEWQDELSLNQDQNRALSVIASRANAVQLSGGATIKRQANELIITGTERNAKDARDLVAHLQRRMVEEAREITRSRRQVKAELAARRRAEARRRQSAIQTQATGGIGTVSGSRGAGPLPIEIAFPGFGTQEYPFYMSFAGTSRPLVEVTCLRSGATMVMQGFVTGLVWAILCLAAWRSPRAGLVLGIALAVVLGFMLKIGNGVSMQYVVMAMAGVVLAAPIVLVRLTGNPLSQQGRGPVNPQTR
jgi:hypothetical protein